MSAPKRTIRVLNAAVVNDPKPTSDERNCLNGDEHAGDIRAEADHGPCGFRFGEEFRIRLSVEVGPREHHGDLHHAVERAASGFEDSPDVPQSLTRLLSHRVADDPVGPPPDLTGIWADTNTKPLATVVCEYGECAAG